MDGALAPEDIPARLVTYGMMSPAQFAAEIDERIELARQDV